MKWKHDTFEVIGCDVRCEVKKNQLWCSRIRDRAKYERFYFVNMIELPAPRPSTTANHILAKITVTADSVYRTCSISISRLLRLSICDAWALLVAVKCNSHILEKIAPRIATSFRYPNARGKRTRNECVCVSILTFMVFQFPNKYSFVVLTNSFFARRFAQHKIWSHIALTIPSVMARTKKWKQGSGCILHKHLKNEMDEFCRACDAAMEYVCSPEPNVVWIM